MEREIIEKLVEALWYWLPADEPHDQHTRNKAYQFKNQKWLDACNILDSAEQFLDKPIGTA